jgi:uncharacterized protein (TIGR03118 family)
VFQSSGFPFVDPGIPIGYAPFNIVYLNGLLYVLYAKQDSAAHDDVAGAGNGFVSVFDTNGIFIKRLITQGYLNSPWGMIMAPASLSGVPVGSFLIGNFGDGSIGIYSSIGAFIDKIKDCNCVQITISGLWGLVNNSSFAVNIFTTSGPNSEANGLITNLISCSNNC